jgi:predicted RNase H-like HicB family nuclease
LCGRAEAIVSLIILSNVRSSRWLDMNRRTSTRKRLPAFCGKQAWIIAMARVSYTIIVESGGENYSAYVPDLPGCVAVGDTVDETLAEMKAAIEFHIEGLKAEGLPVPPPQIISREIELELPAA